MLGIHLIPVQSRNDEMTEEGIRYAVRNENVRGLYVIPDFHNPTTHIMSVETRKIIAEAAKEYGLVVIEDGLNNLLEEKPAPPIASFAPDHIIYLSSLSKTVAAGLRTAFIHIPDRYRQELVTALYSMNIAISPLRYIWLPEYFTGKSFEICADKAGVQVYGAERFAIGNKPAPKTIRIAVTTPANIEDLAECVQHLRELIRQ